MSLVLRCPTCQRRYRPAGSLDDGDLDTHCPHCARKQARRQFDKLAGEMPRVDGGSKIVWIAAAIAGASILVIAMVLAIGYAVTHAHARPEASTPAKPPARTTPARDPIRVPAPPPSSPEPRGPARSNDNDWDR